ncbi:hypothetical protein FRZ67_11710 [Panacibacter ginsenosidivorans]|uniref:Uncharacterized protein n=1 Tax=Panacibacter ginsenosidivorans TaxID=1813871 RepID=A0A5B8V941_9BACT|nr:hypothetical protein [Panacibacter ginsenosidivorans]QEC67934.1 hypothetical protein FRZ67_11710 [Panacibacter ginsenosidivorans]
MANNNSFPKTNGYRSIRLKTFTELSKWLLGGFTGILLFTYDKINCEGLKLAETIIALAGIAISATAFVGFKKASDKMETQMLIDDSTLHLFALTKANPDTWPTMPHKAFIFSLPLLIFYALFAFTPQRFFCPTEPKTVQTDSSAIIINNNYTYLITDSQPKPPTRKTCIVSKRSLLLKNDSTTTKLK